LPLSYTFKRLIRSWQLYIALLLGVLLASTFFAGINMGADTAANQALDQELSKVLVDVYVTPSSDSMTGRKFGLLSSQNVTSAMEAILDIEGVVGVEVQTRAYAPAQVPGKNLSRPSFSVVAISQGSRVYKGWIGGAPTIQANETYVWSGSDDAELFAVGNVIPLNFTVGSSSGFGNYALCTVPMNLTVAGFVELSDEAFALVAGQFYGIDIIAFKQYYPDNLLIVSWERTLARLVDSIYKLSPDYSYVEPAIYVYLDHANLISPWDVSGSISRLREVTFKINNAVSKYYLTASNQLENVLNNYQGVSFGMRFTFIIAALPVIFVAWYMGSTVSHVSFNMRRQEIGLLLTKGFSKRQLLQMFLLEALLIALLGGVIGIVLSLSLSPWFVSAIGGQFGGTPVIGPESIALTMVFALIITFLSVYRPAKRASNMAAVDALRAYMYIEEAKPYRQMWPRVALIFGSFKLVVLLSGINFQAELARFGFPPANILLFILLTALVIVDGVLTFIGPFLFFWGFTKIFIGGSLKFQEVTARAAKFLGDLGDLATKSVQRNPARAAAVAFLIAFIIGYSVQIIGTLASEQDFAVRQTHFTVGSDICATLSSPGNASEVMNTIRSNVSHIKSITVEYSFWGSSGFGGLGERLEMRAIDPNTWLSAAYYESDMFSGRTVENAFEAMRLNNYTVILERNYAKALKKNVGDLVSITFGEKNSEELTIAGFFGIEAPQSTDQTQQQYYHYTKYWSYVPEGLYRELGEEAVGYHTARILIKLESDADGRTVADQIRKLDLDEVGSVSSVAEELEKQQSNFAVMGSLNILRLGVFFIVVAASVGTALVTLVSLRERSREASIMSVRGLSFKQLVIMLLTENLSVVIFAVLLGGVVGLIWVRGTIASQNAMTVMDNPIARRMVLPLEAISTLLISLILVFASTITPVIFMARRYGSRLERVVRQV